MAPSGAFFVAVVAACLPYARGYRDEMASFVVVVVLLGVAAFALTRFAQSDARRLGTAALTALEEHWRPHAAEMQKLDEHAAGVDEDGDGDDDDAPGPAGGGIDVRGPARP